MHATKYISYIIVPDGALYNCISGIGIENHLICSRRTLLNNQKLALSGIANAKRCIKDQKCDDCIYYGMCNGGCSYDKSNNPNKIICQEARFAQKQDTIMDLLFYCVEIKDGIWQRKKEYI